MTETKKKRGGYKPALPEGKKRKMLSIKLPPELIDELSKYGNKTKIIELALIDYLAKMPKN